MIKLTGDNHIFVGITKQVFLVYNFLVPQLTNNFRVKQKKISLLEDTKVSDDTTKYIF